MPGIRGIRTMGGLLTAAIRLPATTVLMTTALLMASAVLMAGLLVGAGNPGGEPGGNPGGEPGGEPSTRYMAAAYPSLIHRGCLVEFRVAAGCGTDDTARCNRLLSEAVRSIGPRPDEARVIVERAAALARTSEYIRGMAVAGLLRGVLLARDARIAEAQREWLTALKWAATLEHDSVAAALHCRLGESRLFVRDTDSAATHLSTALRMWSALGRTREAGEALFYLTVTCRLAGDREGRARYATQLRALAHSTAHPGINGLAVLQRGDLLVEADSCAAALRCFRESLRLFTAASEELMQAVALMRLGVAFNQLGDLDSAAACYARSIEIRKKHHDRRFLFASMNNLGNIRQRQGRFDTALQVFIASLELARTLESPAFVTRALNNVGSIYALRGESEKALAHYLESNRIATSRGLGRFTGETDMNIGLLYLQRGEADSARLHLERSVRVARAAGLPAKQRESLMYLGDAFLALGQRRRARDSYASSLAMSEGSGDLNSVAEVLLRISDAAAADAAAADAESDETGTRDAVRHAERALAIADSISARELTRAALERLAPLQAQLGNLRESNALLLRLIAVKDSLLNAENLRSMNELSARYETARREKEIALQKKDIELKEATLARQRAELARKRIEEEQRVQTIAMQEAELEQQRSESARLRQQGELMEAQNRLQESRLEKENLARWVMLGGVLVLLVLVGLIYRRYLERRRTSQHLAETLAELRRTQDQLVHAEKMATLGEMTAGVAHEIRNPMNFVTNFARMARELSEEARASLADDAEQLPSLLGELEEATKKIAEHSGRAENIVAGMLMHGGTKSGLRTLQIVDRLVEDAVQHAWQAWSARTPGTGLRVSFIPGRNVGSARMLPQEMARVVVNLVQNALQAVAERSRTEDGSFVPTVQVSTLGSEDAVEIVVQDNGPGIPAAIGRKVFQPFFTTKSASEGTGLGLSIAYDIVVKGHGGRIDFDCPQAGGTVFHVSLPR
ncbi:MAG: tetratricopeptide repeat protein [Bacteroidetes bacterium]|nr:tetratricopeptide repeat protein [Bacteroidota bacterium]